MKRPKLKAIIIKSIVFKISDYGLVLFLFILPVSAIPRDFYRIAQANGIKATCA